MKILAAADSIPSGLATNRSPGPSPRRELTLVHVVDDDQPHGEVDIQASDPRAVVQRLGSRPRVLGSSTADIIALTRPEWRCRRTHWSDDCRIWSAQFRSLQQTKWVTTDRPRARWRVLPAGCSGCQNIGRVGLAPR